METVAGIFSTRSHADTAAAKLRANGIPESKINILAPDSTQRDLNSVPTTETEQPGMGKALGAVVGGATGASTAVAAASLLVPGVGPVFAAGVAAMGILGAIAGAKVGDALEESLDFGLPKDELFFYEDALRRGHVVLIALVEDDDQAEQTRQTLRASGAEDIDAARETWWIGLRDGERAEYDLDKGDFVRDEAHYRHGFESALHPEIRGRSYAEAEATLRERHAAICDLPAFRQGYERGCRYRERMISGTATGRDERRSGAAPVARENEVHHA